MSVSVTKAGPYFASGSISFSQLKSNFGGGNRFSDYLRNTSIDTADPVVPDSTENERISTSSNLKYSQFRNSIKRYYATQSGTDHNSSYSTEPGFRMGRYDSNGRGIDWSGGGVNGRDGQGGGTSGNLTKNIQKYIYITGVCGSYYTDQPAAQLNPDTSIINIRIDVSGGIYGAGGNGGYPSGRVVNGVAGGTGFDGGMALNLSNAGTGVSRNIFINVQSNGQIYGGGGGGGKGRNGYDGSAGTCYTYSYYSYSACGGGNKCNSGGNVINVNNSGGNDCNCRKGGCRDRTYSNDCQVANAYSVPGAPGGLGGNGGNGQGYNHSRSNGENGASGTSGGCPNYGGSGENGTRGGDGGDWGSNGNNGVGRPGDGGWPGGVSGASINVSANNYRLTGSVNSSTCRGPVNA
jgi:hypothetical protein